MNSKTKIKIRVADIKIEVEKLAIRETQDNEAAQEKYLVDLEQFPGKVRAALHDLETKLIYTDVNMLTLRNCVPSRPTKPAVQTRYAKTLDFLNMSSEETLLLSMDDYQAYLNGNVCR